MAVCTLLIEDCLAELVSGRTSGTSLSRSLSAISEPGAVMLGLLWESAKVDISVLEGSSVLMLGSISLADASEAEYPAIEAADSDPSEVMDGLPKVLRTKNCDMEGLPLAMDGEVVRGLDGEMGEAVGERSACKRVSMRAGKR